MTTHVTQRYRQSFVIDEFSSKNLLFLGMWVSGRNQDSVKVLPKKRIRSNRIMPTRFLRQIMVKGGEHKFATNLVQSALRKIEIRGSARYRKRAAAPIYV